MNLLIIGAGKMATALSSAIVNNNVFPVDNIRAVDISPAARTAFTSATGIKCEEAPGPFIQWADVILLAVKPQVAGELVKSLPQVPENTLVISICAGITIARLSSWFNTGKIIRVMPNTPLMVGKGASAFAPGPQADECDCELAMAILGKAGLALQVDETLMDAVTALSGSGPAYVFELAKAMSLAGEKAGLPSRISLELTLQTIAGAAEMLIQKLGSPDELRDAVTSPNGTTAAGLEIMKKGNFRQIIEDTVLAARDRSAELGK